MNKSNIKKITVLAVLLGLLALIVPTPSLDELIYVSGHVVNSKLSRNGVGAIVEIQTKSGVSETFVISGLTSESNIVVRTLEPGDSLEVWYSKFCCLIKNSKDVWKLNKDGAQLKSYDSSLSRAKLTKYILGIPSIVLFLIILFYLNTSVRWIQKLRR